MDDAQCMQSMQGFKAGPQQQSHLARLVEQADASPRLAFPNAAQFLPIIQRRPGILRVHPLDAARLEF